MLKYIYTDEQSVSMVDLIKTTLMIFFSNFNRSLEVILMTGDSDSYNGNFLKDIWWSIHFQRIFCRPT